MVLIAPSLLASDFTSLGKQIALVEEGELTGFISM